MYLFSINEIKRNIMMISNNYCHALFFSIFNLLNRSNSIIACNDCICAIIICFIY